MLSWVHILLIGCVLFVNVCVSQIHVVIDPQVTQELSENKTPFKNMSGISILAEKDPQFYRLVLNGSKLYVGGRESLDTIDLTDWSVSNNVTFSTTTSSDTSCQSNNLLDGILCYNYVTIIEPKDDCLFVCGTDALTPKCYYVNPMDGTATPTTSYSDKGVAPKDPKQNSTWLYLTADDKYFSATGMPVDGSGSSSGFLLANQSECNDVFAKGLTHHDDRKWLNAPHFVGEPIEYGAYVYFFFREFATEHINAGRVVYSRVARVCKNDVGGLPFTQLGGKFLTYQKARLNCSTSIGAGDSNFMYNHIQDVYYDTDKMRVYAVFTTSQPGPTSSAICVYHMSDIASVFQTSKFWGTNMPENLWSNPTTVPSTRPGQCDESYDSGDSNFRLFLVNYPLLEDLVQSKLTVVQDNVSYVQVIVEEVNNQTLMLLGTDRNSIIKAAFNGSTVEMFGEIDLNLDGKPQSPILNIIKDNASMYISTEYSVYKLPLEACASRDPCDDCSKDPYCILSGTKCVEYRSVPVLPGNTSHCKNSEAKIEVNYGEVTKTISTAKNQRKNMNFAVSAKSNLNLSADVNCDDNCKPVDQFSKSSVCGDEEMLIVQYSIKVDKDCTCDVTFTANGAEDVRRETSFVVDASPQVTDENCIKYVQSFDEQMIWYMYKLQQWKNELIQKSNCAQSFCNEQIQTACLDGITQD